MKTVLVPTDFNPLAAAALSHAVRFAEATGAEIVVLYADTFSPPAEFTARQTASVADAIALSRHRTEEELVQWAREIVPPGLKVSTIVREDFPVAAIVDVAEEIDASLIVMGTHGRGGLARIFLGSVTLSVLRETKRPVLTVTRTTPVLPIRKVACADDQSSPFAAELVQRLNAVLSPSVDDADLIVACHQDGPLVRTSPVPVLTIRARAGETSGTA